MTLSEFRYGAGGLEVGFCPPELKSQIILCNSLGSQIIQVELRRRRVHQLNSFATFRGHVALTIKSIEASLPPSRPVRIELVSPPFPVYAVLSHRARVGLASAACQHLIICAVINDKVFVRDVSLSPVCLRVLFRSAPFSHFVYSMGK